MASPSPHQSHTLTPSTSSPSSTTNTQYRQGVTCALIAYFLWGFFPIYFKIAHMVPPIEMLAHRIVWSVPFGAVIILARKQIRDVVIAMTNWRTLGFLTLAAAFIAINWGVYIHAVQQGQIFQASLGYYINPLFYVVVGVFIFKERLTRPQLIAVSLAALGVGILTIYGGQFPTISIILAVSFTIYGIIRKQVAVGGMPGLFIETLVLFPIALIYLLIIAKTGAPQFSPSQPKVIALLLLAGPLTVLPLLAFALAARRLPLSTLGFLQFIGPSIQFGVGLAYGEELSHARLMCMILIWSAVIIFCYGAISSSRKTAQATKDNTTQTEPS